MNFRFPLNDVKIEEVSFLEKIKDAKEIEENLLMNQNEFQLNIDKLGVFQVLRGKTIYFKPYHKKYFRNEAELYLNGSVLGAILHQRKILHFHASSFIYQDQGILICGESGAGKSTSTLTFCLRDAKFLTDDITPIIFSSDGAYIWGISDRVKLWKDAFHSLDLIPDERNKIYLEEEKYFLEYESSCQMIKPSVIFVLELSNSLNYVEIKGNEKFEVLYNQIYRLAYLKAMPESEKSYLSKLAEIAQSTKIFKIQRPFEIHPFELKVYIERILFSFCNFEYNFQF